MSDVTTTELKAAQQLLRFEKALYEKFHHYAEQATEQATRRLCLQLGDRSREHYRALVDCLAAGDTN